MFKDIRSYFNYHDLVVAVDNIEWNEKHKLNICKKCDVMMLHTNRDFSCECDMY